MTVYISPKNRVITVSEKDRYNNQRIITGVDQSFLIEKGIFFIEYIESTTGTTVSIADGDGTTIATGISYFSQDYSPIRCDYGVTITGNLIMLKGFIMQNVFES